MSKQSKKPDEASDDPFADEASGIVKVPFGDEGLKLWRAELKASLGSRELTRLLLAGVDPDEAYERAMQVQKEADADADAATEPSPQPNPEDPPAP